MARNVFIRSNPPLAFDGTSQEIDILLGLAHLEVLRAAWSVRPPELVGTKTSVKALL